MLHRFLFVLIVGLISTRPVQGHRLLVNYEVMPGRLIQVRTEFEIGGGVAFGAKLQVYIQPNQLLYEAPLNVDGTATFRFNQLAPLRIVVQDTTGHRAKVDIPTTKLRSSFERSILSDIGLCISPNKSTFTRGVLLSQMTLTDIHRHPSEPEDSESKPPSKIGFMLKLLIGVGFLLAIAAFFIALRNAREIEKLKRKG